MMMKRWLIPLALALAACDPTTPPQPETPESAFSSQPQALDKARAVEGQLRDAAAAQNRQIDEAAR